MQIDIALEPELDADQLAELAVLAEQNGIATLWVTNDTQARDLFMLFCKAAEVTQRIRLGVMAVSPFEVHPVKLAASLNTLNEISGGRASLIVGGGGAIQAHTKLDLSRRVRAVRECIEIIKDSNAERPLNYAGEIYPVWNFRLAWAEGVAPLVLAGSNREQMLRMAAHRADGVHMSDMPLPDTPWAIDTVKTALEANGRSAEDFEFNNFWAFHVKQDRAEAEREARSRLILRGMLMTHYIDPFLNEADTTYVRNNLEGFYSAFNKRDGVIDNVPEQIINTLVENLTLTCATAELDSRLGVLHEFAAAGLTHITLGLHDEPADMIRIIGERVRPAFAAH